MTGKNEIKKKIEAKYARKEPKVDSGTDHVGQMTIAFCDWHSVERVIRGE